MKKIFILWGLCVVYAACALEREPDIKEEPRDNKRNSGFYEPVGSHQTQSFPKVPDDQTTSELSGQAGLSRNTPQRYHDVTLPKKGAPHIIDSAPAPADTPHIVKQGFASRLTTRIRSFFKKIFSSTTPEEQAAIKSIEESITKETSLNDITEKIDASNLTPQQKKEFIEEVRMSVPEYVSFKKRVFDNADNPKKSLIEFIDSYKEENLKDIDRLVYQRDTYAPKPFQPSFSIVEGSQGAADIAYVNVVIAALKKAVDPTPENEHAFDLYVARLEKLEEDFDTHWSKLSPDDQRGMSKSKDVMKVYKDKIDAYLKTAAKK